MDAGVTLSGIGVTPGRAVGAAWILREVAPSPRAAASGSPRDEVEQLERAVADARKELQAMLEELAPATAQAGILRAYLALLDDPALIDDTRHRIERDRTSADAALAQTTDSLVARFEKLHDPALRARAADVRDVCDAIRRRLAPEPAVQPLPAEPCVVCAADLSPLQLVQLARRPVVAIVLERGEEVSHTTILLRSMNLPAVIRAGAVTEAARDGDRLLVDGDEGRVVVRAADGIDSDAASARPHTGGDPHAAVTRDGIEIAVRANIAHAAEAEAAAAAGADGIGLFRTEFLFMADRPPSEDDQERAYLRVVEALQPHIVTIRTIDLGGDKDAPWLGLAREPNPALGLRGVRLSHARPEVAEVQLRALLRLSARSAVRVLLPMVTSPDEVVRTRATIAKAARAMNADVDHLQIGAMVETPAAAIAADDLADVSDFLSIGTNDLTQYVLAVDRTNENVRNLYDPLHPAVVRLLGTVAAAGARRGIPVGVCGALAADPRAVPLLLGLGVRELSVPVGSIVGIKRLVRRLAVRDLVTLPDEFASLRTRDLLMARLRDLCRCPDD